MEKAVTRDKPCKCPHCGKDTMLLIDINGRAHRYMDMVRDRNVSKINDNLDNFIFSNMRCQICRTEYPIDWTWILPRPLSVYPENISFYTPDNS